MKQYDSIYTLDFSSNNAAIPEGIATCTISAARIHKTNPDIVEVFATENTTGATVYMSFPLTLLWARQSLKQLCCVIEPKITTKTKILDVVDFLNERLHREFSAELTKSKVNNLFNVKLHTIQAANVEVL